MHILTFQGDIVAVSFLTFLIYEVLMSCAKRSGPVFTTGIRQAAASMPLLKPSHLLDKKM